MNHQELVAKFRDDRIGSGGALRAAAGEKLFIKVNLFQNDTPSDQSNFKVWVKGRVSKALFDSVQLEDIGVVNKFENEEKQRACKDNFIEIEKRFRGAKTIKLNKEDSWILVPTDMTTGLSSLFQEQISDALGLIDSIEEEHEEAPQLEKPDKDILLQTIETKVVLGNEQKQKWGEIFMAIALDTSFKVTPPKQVIQFFSPKEQYDEEFENLLYVANVLQEYLGMSLIRQIDDRRGFEENWMKLNKEAAITFKFIYSCLCDRLDPSKDSVKETFPQAGKLQEITSKLKYSLDRINLELEKLVNTPPRVPEKKYHL